MISHAHKFVFIHIPRTGGNSVQSLLVDFSEQELIVKGQQDGVERFGTSGIRKHAHLSEYADVLDLDEFFVFSTVRNPWDQTVSQYFRSHEAFDRKAFKAKCLRRKSMMHWISMDPGSGRGHGLDFVIRFEDLQQGFDEACERIGIPHMELPRRNSTTHRDYQDYFDDETRDIIAETCGEEIDLFGYEF